MQLKQMNSHSFCGYTALQPSNNLMKMSLEIVFIVIPF